MRLVVLDDKLAVLASDLILSDRAMYEMRTGFEGAAPGWRILILQGPSEVADFRGDERLSALAEELRGLLDAVPA